MLTTLSFLPANFSLISLFSFSVVEMENFRDQAEDENVFALVLGRAAERFDGQTSDGHADVNETFIVQVRLDVVRIVKQDAAFAQKVDVVLVTVLVKRDEKIGFIARREHFARTDADLENGWPTRDRGRDGHVGHDVVLAASGQPGEERAGSFEFRPANYPRAG